MNCDKCGKLVPPENDAVRLEILAGFGDFTLIMAEPRHLLPTENCSGSPSRAQYLEGQLLDPRYPFQPEYVARYRAAYAEMTGGNDHVSNSTNQDAKSVQEPIP